MAALEVAPESTFFAFPHFSYNHFSADLGLTPFDLNTFFLRRATAVLVDAPFWFRLILLQYLSIQLELIGFSACWMETLNLICRLWSSRRTPEWLGTNGFDFYSFALVTSVGPDIAMIVCGASVSVHLTCFRRQEGIAQIRMCLVQILHIR